MTYLPLVLISTKMYVVFGHPVRHLYKTHFASRATVFYALASVLTFVPPLLITYRSQGFWLRTATYLEQPEVHFQHELIVLLETEDPTRPLGWSTFENFKVLLMDNVRVPRITATEHDWNRDGKYDGLELELEMPLKPTENVFGVNLALLFDVKLHRFSSVHLNGLAFVQGGSAAPLAASGVDVVGDLRIVQRQPIAHKGRDERFTAPVFNASSVFAETFDFAAALRDYSRRNLTTRLENEYVTWNRGSLAETPFVLKASISYPEQEIAYKPGFWQMMKWAWVQYASVLIVFVYVFRNIKTYVFEKQILPTSTSITEEKLKSH